MGRNRNWTKQEEEYLEENWGQIAIPTLAKNLNRSEDAIRVRAQRLQLGAFLDAGDYMTMNQLTLVLKGHNINTYYMTSWVKNKGFPVKYKKVGQDRFRVVCLEDFWKWAEKHRDFFDWSKVEKNILGKEPAWVDEKRREQFQRNRQYKTTPWTKAEDELLISLLKEQKYGFHEISKRLGRTAGAIQRRCCDLKTPYRPVKAENHNTWMQEELDLLAEMIREQRSYEYMADKLDRSSKAIRGLVYRMYLTERVDKVAVIIGNGKWGDNRPLRPIKHTTLTTEERMEVKRDMTRLLAIFRRQIKAQYDGDDYWQKDMCQHWDGYCTMDETNCDECTKFQRIREQYCVRCGKTFFERRENRLCADCRAARKKQAQRKYAIMHGKRVYNFEEAEG